MIVSLIVAASENNAIGKDNKLPWHLPDDLKFFKRTTLGKPVLMGRKTYESLGKPLPGRLNIVLSRDTSIILPEGVLVFRDLKSAFEYCEEQNCEEVMVLGGGDIFSQAMPLADRMYITRVHMNLNDGDTFFPVLDHTHWKLVWQERHDVDEKHAFAFTFEQYERIEL